MGTFLIYAKCHYYVLIKPSIRRRFKHIKNTNVIRPSFSEDHESPPAIADWCQGDSNRLPDYSWLTYGICQSETLFGNIVHPARPNDSTLEK